MNDERKTTREEAGASPFSTQHSVLSVFPYFPLVAASGKVYMHRWLLCVRGGHTLWLHYIVSGDHVRGFHDHPWDYTTLILAGGYDEELLVPSTQDSVPGLSTEYQVPSTSLKLRPGECVFRAAEDRHRFMLAEPTWTLCLTGPARHRQRFYLPDGRELTHREYMNLE